jgi:predicted Fe-S protein YdhL (DUF1289 family)
MAIFQNSPKPMLSPCIGICRLRDNGLCEGCHRTADEIARWTIYTDAERLQLMKDVLPRRSDAANHD